MILKEQTVISVEGDEFEKYESKINTEKLSKLYGILSGLYRNVPGSIVREYCSNAWDSHQEAGREDEPIIVKLKEEYKNNQLIIKDVGLGMSPKTMGEIYFNYLDSTKEDSDDMIGAFGIGGKSALAYTHTFYIDTIYDGILYHYIFSKQANGIPAGELLYTENTEDHNGTTIKVPIKDEDIMSFNKEFKRQLCYFPNIYIDSDLQVFDNDYTIYDTKLFKYREDLDIFGGSMHLLLGDVPYAIDWTELDISPVSIPVAIKFKIGELMPTPSRESVEYTKESIKAIKNKIKEVVKYLTDKYNSTIKDVDSLSDYLKYRTDGYGSFISIYLTDEVSVRVNKSELPDLKQVTIERLKGLVSPNVVLNYLYCDYTLMNYYVADTGYKRDYTFYHDTSSAIKNITEGYNFERGNDKVFIFDGDLDHKKNKYLVTDSMLSRIFFIKPKKKSLRNYRDKLPLNASNKSKWRDIIKVFQELSEEYIREVIPLYDDVVIDEDWLEDYESSKKEGLKDLFERRKAEKKIVFYTPVSGYNKAYIWDKDEATISDIKKMSKNIIYAESKSKGDLIDFFHILQDTHISKQGWTVITTAKSFHKHFKNEEHMYDYSEFRKGKSRLLIRIATSRYITNELEKIHRFFFSKEFGKIKYDVYQKLQNLKNYTNSTLRSGWYDYDRNKVINAICDAIHKLDALDEDKLSELKIITDYIEGLDDIAKIFSRAESDSISYYRYLVNLIRTEGKPVDKIWYLKDEYNPVCDEFKVEEDND